MFTFLNQYSFVIAFVILFVSLAAFLPTKRWRVRIPVYASAAVFALLIYVLLRPGDSSVSTASEADQVLASGQPVFVEFFSNTCAACLASKPFVESMRGDLEDEVVFMQLNVQDAAAVPLMRRFTVTSTPTFIGLDEDGQLVFRQSGILDGSKAREAMLGGA